MLSRLREALQLALGGLALRDVNRRRGHADGPPVLAPGDQRRLHVDDDVVLALAPSVVAHRLAGRHPGADIGQRVLGLAAEG